MSLTLDPMDPARREWALAAWRRSRRNPADHWPDEPDRGIPEDAETWRCECGRMVSFWDVMVLVPVTCLDCWLQQRAEAGHDDA